MPTSFRARLRLVRTEDGGRAGPIWSNLWRPIWDLDSRRSPVSAQFNSAAVLVPDGEQLRPGDEGIVRIEPLDPGLWAAVREGDVLRAFENAVQCVGEATVLSVEH